MNLLVSRPKVIIKRNRWSESEPIERLVVNVPDDCIGNVKKLRKKKAERLIWTSRSRTITKSGILKYLLED